MLCSKLIPMAHRHNIKFYFLLPVGIRHTNKGKVGVIDLDVLFFRVKWGASFFISLQPLLLFNEKIAHWMIFSDGIGVCQSKNFLKNSCRLSFALYCAVSKLKIIFVVSNASKPLANY